MDVWRWTGRGLLWALLHSTTSPSPHHPRHRLHPSDETHASAASQPNLTHNPPPARPPARPGCCQSFVCGVRCPEEFDDTGVWLGFGVPVALVSASWAVMVRACRRACARTAQGESVDVCTCVCLKAQGKE